MMGKTHSIAETGAKTRRGYGYGGGPAKMDCTIFMGAEDVELRP
ncbi:MAG: hypothetical protein ACLT8E_06530 [Akkermansia sp.]